MFQKNLLGTKTFGTSYSATTNLLSVEIWNRSAKLSVSQKFFLKHSVNNLKFSFVRFHHFNNNWKLTRSLSSPIFLHCQVRLEKLLECLETHQFFVEGLVGHWGTRATFLVLCWIPQSSNVFFSWRWNMEMEFWTQFHHHHRHSHLYSAYFYDFQGLCCGSSVAQ